MQCPQRLGVLASSNGQRLECRAFEKLVPALRSWGIQGFSDEFVFQRAAGIMGRSLSSGEPFPCFEMFRVQLGGEEAQERMGRVRLDSSIEVTHWVPLLPDRVKFL